MTITRRTIPCIAILLFAIYLPISGFSQSSSEGQQNLVNQLIEQLALKNQIKAIPADIRAQFEQNPLNISAGNNERMLQLFDQAYDIERLLDDFKTILQQKMTENYGEEISQMLNDSNIEAVTNARRQFYALQGQRKQIITKYEMEKQPPSPEQKTAIEALVDTTSAAVGSVETSIIVLRSVIKALSSLSDKRNFTDAQITTITKNFRNQMQAQASQQINHQLMVIYYNVDIDALKKYTAFMQSDAGQWLDKAILQSMKKVYTAASDRFLQTIQQK